MPRTGSEEEWALCDRCGFRQTLSNLRRQPTTGLLLCTVKAKCYDEPNFNDNEQKQQSHFGLIFDP